MMRTERAITPTMQPWLALTLLLFSLPAWSQALPHAEPEQVGMSSERLQRIAPVMQSYIDDGKLAGSLVLLARRGKVTYLESFGAMDREKDKAMQEDVIFRIASMTKAVTSVAAMMMYEEGRLLLTDPISKYIPAFKEPKVLVPNAELEAGYELVPAKREITVRDLLAHTSGITYGFWGREHFHELYMEAGISDGLTQTEGTMGEMVERLAALPLTGQPGEVWEYGLNTDVLGHLVEVVSGQSLDAFFRERILTPLKLTDTHFFLPEDKLPRLAAVYRPGEQGVERVPETEQKVLTAIFSPSVNYSGPRTFFSGGGGLVSTISDYTRFLQMLLNEGELGGVRLLSRKTVEMMTVNHIGDLEILTPGHGFSLGFAVHKGPGESGRIHSAGTYEWGGFYFTDYWVDPDEQLIGVFMAQLYPWDGLDAHDKFRVLSYQAIAD